MRSVHLVGPGPDGDLVVTTDDGDELALVVDDRLRAAVRGERPTRAVKAGRLENAMDTSFSPRDVQMRIRAGESLEDVAEIAGIPYDRVERFAAPVLAEREHLALMALAASVRRRGETAGHRNLRTTVAERLLKRGVDGDSIDWDSHRLEDGRWAVTADYRLDESERHATFWFDPRGRFSVAGDDEARWLIGEQDAGTAPRRRDAANEPTVDLSDELALVRATQEAGAAAEVADDRAGSDGVGGADESGSDEEHDVLPGALVTEAVVTAVVVTQTVETQTVETQTETVVRALSAVPQLAEDETGGDEPDAADEPAAADDDLLTPGVEDGSELNALYAMLGSDGYSEDSPRIYAGLTDAAAVPETAGGGWEPAIVIDYPVEPSVAEEAALPAAEHPDRSQVPMDDKASVELSTPVDQGARPAGRRPGTDEPAPPYARTDEADRAEEAEEFQLEADPPPEKKAKRKRASVPSWDEIMFGGPKPQD